MKCILSQRDNFEQEIFNSLQSSLIDRRKGEEKLFIKYSYLIAVGKQKYSISEVDSFDAYSDTVLATILSITNGTFQGKSSLKTYLHSIFYNRCVDVVRKKESKKNSIHLTSLIDESQLYLSDTTKSIVEKLIMKYDFDILKQKLSQLSNTSQQVLLLSADGYTDKEIASVLNFKTANVVKTTRLRCLKKLHQLIKQKNTS